MTGLLALVGLGFVLGMRHATDADHVVAVSTLVSHERSVKVAAGLGAMWGIGHAMTIAVVGGAIIAFNVVVPPPLGLAMEMAVGLMLVLLGLVNVRGAMRGGRLPSVAHTHATEPGGAARPRAKYAFRPLAIGIVHGLAGSAAVALLVLTTIREPRWAIAYLLVYAAGTVAGMVLVTTAMAWPLLHIRRDTTSTGRRLQMATGLFSVAFGAALAYRIGYLGGWFGH